MFPSARESDDASIRCDDCLREASSLGLDAVRWRDTEEEDSGGEDAVVFLEPTGPFLMPGEAPPEEALAMFRVPPPLPLGTRPSWVPEPPEPEARETDPDVTDPDEIGDDAIVIEQAAAAHGVATAARSSWKSLAIAFAAGVFAGAVMVMTVTG